MRLLLSALLACALTASAQSGLITNALGGFRYNVVTPQMLATVSEASPVVGIVVTGVLSASPYVAPIQTPASAQVFIRPAGSATALPVTVTSAFTGGASRATFVVPAGLPLGSAEVYWQIGTAPWRFTTVTVSPNNFAFSPEIRALNPNGSTSQVGLATPARPGQTVSLTGSGLGFANSVSALIGDTPARVVYAGHGPAAGYDTLQVEVPQGVGGCNVPLQLTVGDLAAFASLSVSPDGAPCQHPFALTPADLKALDAGGWLAVGHLDINSTLAVTSEASAARDERVSFSIYQTSASVLAGNTASPSGCSEAPGTIATSIWFPTLLYAPVGSVAPAAPASPAPDPPSLGATVTLTGPAATYKLSGYGGTNFYTQFPTPVDFPLASPSAPNLSAGKWILSTPGSPALAAASVAFTLPKPLQLAGPANPKIQRNQDRAFTWDGTAFGSADNVTLNLTGTSSGGTATRTVACAAPARAGVITVPASLLAAFDGPGLGTVTLSTGYANPHVQAVRLTTANGSPLVVYVTYTSSDTRPVDF